MISNTKTIRVKKIISTINTVKVLDPPGSQCGRWRHSVEDRAGNGDFFTDTTPLWECKSQRDLLLYCFKC